MSASRGAALLALLAWALYVPSAAAEQCQGGSWDASGDVDLLIRSAAAESSALCVGGGCAAGSSAARIHSLLLRAEAALDAQPAPGPAEGGGSADAEGGEWEAAAPADTRRESACSSLQGEIERLRSRIQDADSWNRISYEIEGEEARQVRTPLASSPREPLRLHSPLPCAYMRVLCDTAAARGCCRRRLRGERAEGDRRPVPAGRRGPRRRPS